MSEVLSATNLKFLAQGMWTTLYLSFFIIVLSTLFGTILAVMRNGKNPILRWMASVYVEFVRNVPNLLWIFIIFLVFQLKSTAAGITSFTVFTSAALAEIIRGGLNSIDQGQTEAGLLLSFLGRISCSRLRLGLMIPLTMCRPLLGLPSSTLSCVSL